MIEIEKVCVVTVFCLPPSSRLLSSRFPSGKATIVTHSVCNSAQVLEFALKLLVLLTQMTEYITELYFAFSTQTISEHSHHYFHCIWS